MPAPRGRPLTHALAAAALGLVVAAGSFVGSTPGPAEAATCNASPVTSGSVWRGRYTCGQGLTDLTLTMQSVRGTAVTALFEFDWREGGIQGRFLMRGALDLRTCRLSLRSSRWLEAPPGWVMVSLDGSLSKHGTLYSGRVRPDTGGRACTTFSVTRVH